MSEINANYLNIFKEGVKLLPKSKDRILAETFINNRSFEELYELIVAVGKKCKHDKDCDPMLANKLGKYAVEVKMYVDLING